MMLLYINKAKTLTNLEKYEEAIQCCDKAIEIRSQ